MTSTPGLSRNSSLRQKIFWVVVSVGSLVLFSSWLWLALVTEGAEQDRGQGGQDYADWYFRTLGVAPVVGAHIVVLLTVLLLGAWSRRRVGVRIIIGVLICVAASGGGLLLSVSLSAPVQGLP